MQNQTAEHEIRKCPTHAPSALPSTPLINSLYRGGSKEEEGGRKEEEWAQENVPLVADGLEFILVLRVGLDAQAGGQDELTDGGAEAGEEGVEGLGLVSLCFWVVFLSTPWVFAGGMDW